MIRGQRTIQALAALCVLGLVGALVWINVQAGPVKHVTAHFTRAVGVYENSDVRILGVKVGRVTRVTPEGATVRVELEYDAKYQVPANAVAMVVPPALVSDRYVQLAPVYKGGPALADHAELGLNRTATPVELDDIYKTVDNLSVALGPNGANKDGALARFLDVGAANLDGTGKQLHQTLTDFSQAVRTLSESRGDLFGTVQNLQVFVTALANADEQVRAFNSNLANVSKQLADERQTLGLALANLADTLGQVTTFVHDNRALVKKNLSGLTSLTGLLVKQRAALGELLDVAPAGLSNIGNAYNAEYGTLDARSNLGQVLQDPLALCAIVVSAGINNNEVCNLVKQIFGLIPKIPGLTGPGDPVNGTPLLPGLPALPGLGGSVPSLPGLPQLPLIPGTNATSGQQNPSGGSVLDPVTGLLGGGGR